MIVISNGIKGGVGKSIVSALSLDYFIAKNDTPVLIETDKSNPDVYKAYKDCTAAHCINIDTSQGWTDMMSVIGDNTNSNVVINCGASNLPTFLKFGATFEMLKVKKVHFWTMNTKRDSTLMLKNYAEVINPNDIVVVKNLCFGEEEDFKHYNNSQVAQKISQPVLCLPELVDSAFLPFYDDRIPFHQMIEKLKFGERIMFEMWIGKVRPLFAQALAE